MTNYKKGWRFEHRTQKYLTKIGYYVIRSYGSKGLFDLIAVPPSNDKGIHNYPLLIQAKSNGYVPKEELKNLREESPKWQGVPIISYSKKKYKNSKNTILLFKSLDGHNLVVDAFLTEKKRK
jgi:Holliday junction resolvase